jgi:hypothetical protein
MLEQGPFLGREGSSAGLPSRSPSELSPAERVGLTPGPARGRISADGGGDEAAPLDSTDFSGGTELRDDWENGMTRDFDGIRETPAKAARRQASSDWFDPGRRNPPPPSIQDHLREQLSECGCRR